MNNSIEIEFGKPGELPKEPGLYLVRDHPHLYPEFTAMHDEDLGSTDYPPETQWSLQRFTFKDAQ